MSDVTIAVPAAAPPVPAPGIWRRAKPVLLSLVVPLLLLLGWHLAVANGLTRLIPSPAEVVRIHGGLRDRRHLGRRLLRHAAHPPAGLGQPGLWRFVLAALVAIPLGL
jgi:NitT/TauT family transport system permease protein